MAQQYLLPCECGRANPVTVAQAGRILRCECGQDLRVPTLAALRQLEPVSSPLPKDKPAPWNSTRGALFVVGLVLAMAGLGAGGYASYVLRHVDVEKVAKYEQTLETMQLEEIDTMTPDQAYDVWQKILVMGPGTTGTAVSVQVQQFHDFYLRMAIISFGTAAVGILMAAGSLVRIGSQSQGS